MKALPYLLAALVLFPLVSCSALSITYDVYRYGTFDSSIKLNPAVENQLDLWVLMTSDVPVAGVLYDTVLPFSGWELTSRAYGTYGWDEDTGWDFSFPSGATVPQTVDAALYESLSDPGAIDFHFESFRSDLTGVTGTTVVERFLLTIPAFSQYGLYSISLDDMDAYDEGGDAYSQADPPTQATGNGFDIRFSDIPEPGSALLFGGGLLGLMLVRSRRRRQAAE